MAVALAIKDPNKEKEMIVGRAIAFFVVVVLCVCILVARFVQLQIYEHESYQSRSDKNRIQVQPLAPPRGLIYDTNGILLADNRPSSALGIVVERTDELDAVIAELREIIALSDEQVEQFHEAKKRARRPGEAVVIADNLSDADIAALAVNRHRITGVEVITQLQRYYPLGAIAAHAVGSVRRMTERDVQQNDEAAYRATQFIGKRGVEAYYEEALHGRPGFQQVETDAHGRIRKVIDSDPPTVGKNLTLHLDARLQQAAVDALGEQRGAIVAIDPKTGGVLALVSKPSYDPNQFIVGMTDAQFQALSGSVYVPLFNRATNGQYAPGSTFKPVVGLAGIASGAMQWDTQIDDNGSFRLPGGEREYRDWSWTVDNSGGQGVVDLRRAIYRSSNVYFYDVASRLDVNYLAGFAEGFGFGRNLAVDISDASRGLVPDPEWKLGAKGEKWYQGDSVNMGIGQGDLLVTPLQIATYVAMIANGGKTVRPRMVKGPEAAPVSDAASYEPTHLTSLTDDDWLRLIASMEDVVHLGGQGFRGNGTAWAYIGQDISYRMAGKSGTAQVVEIRQGEEYNEEELSEFRRKHAWFMAFAPVDDPQIALAVLVENGGGGSSVAAPVARKVVDAYLGSPVVMQ
ncbi:MAG: penicillin-binding protein 2 [Pseudomonadota bacterium]|nr:penicillin-binding protein 2 [Pseudomonadales bacterium]MEC7975239.1 penicillin-binding protein 2 [Pseudomonadota bacterium]MEC8809082.1 penicillin-binding protein 2 [Pseudomonadota bacterium]MEE2823999.1 penicillin-binding protein 2 [Pseudomonadota bacterium]